MSSKQIIASFIDDAPPGEFNEVINDIKALSENDNVPKDHETAIEAHNKDQLITTRLPGSSKLTIISKYNELEPGRFFDSENSKSFAFDHITQKASEVEAFELDGDSSGSIKQALGEVEAHVHEHYPSLPAYGVYPTEEGMAILIVGNKYSPSNYWNGRWRATYLFNSSSSTLNGSIHVDVHYYEDGNVRMVTNKPVSETVKGSSPKDVVKAIAGLEKRYQEELNKAFNALNEGTFKSLRRQLPVTRQKVDWDKIMGYRLGQDIGGGRSR